MIVDWLQIAKILNTHFSANSLIKMTLSSYKGKEELKNIYIKKVQIKKQDKLSFTFRYKQRDIVKNYNIAESIEVLQQQFSKVNFSILNLFSLENDYVFSILKNQNIDCKIMPASITTLQSTTHDISKKRKINSENKAYLQALKITDANGEVYKNAQDKFKQINHYIEILSTSLSKLSDNKVINVADMGSGKGYLTFALYDYLTNSLQKKAAITGVEYRQDLVTLCNNIAAAANFNQLKFEQGAIANYQPKDLDILIALHACDTATDDAIAIGINNNAHLIVVAPCCHKQIRKEMNNGQPNEILDSILKYGLFFERQAEMLTDSIRTLILNYFGYQTKVVDFISDLHTPKNVLIIAEKSKSDLQINKEKILATLQKMKAFFGIDQHYLETILLPKN